MRRPRALVWFALAAGLAGLVALGPVACAGLVGANFDAEHLGAVGESDGSVQPGVDSSTPVTPHHDSGSGPGVDSSVPVIPAEGGTCPTGLTNCGGLCVDLQNDPDHCGKCATTCPGDPNGAAVCVKAHCTFACDQGWVECAGGCCGTGSDASSAADTAVPPTKDPDSGGGGTTVDPGIACGAAHCPVASNSFCCGKASGDTCDTNLQDTCATEVFCDNAAECGQNGVCCYDATNQTFCETSCASGQKQLCNPAASGECGATLQCTGTFAPSGGSSGGTVSGTSYSYCQ
jgi:hypothetical protein